MSTAPAVTQSHFAQRISGLKPSPIRDILKVIDQPGMVSFAGGLPNPDSFPVLSSEIPSRYLQYGPSEGEFELRERVSELLAKRGLNCPAERVLILSGSQQGIDLVAKLFIEEGSTIALEYPSYLAALQVFDLFGAAYVPLDELNATTSLAYAIPTFQNPTGYCYTLEQRQQLAKQCDATSTVLFEDDPYTDLFYEDVCQTPVCSLLQNTSWIYQGSFSKTFCPGLRLGYIACSEDIYPYLVQLKQASDLHSNRISQYLIMELLNRADYAERSAEIRALYRAKRDYFDKTLGNLMADQATWETPSGGLFFWLQLKDSKISVNELFQRCVERGVAFMPGNHFFPQGDTNDSYLRLNFSHASELQTQSGLQILAKTIAEISGQGMKR